MVFLRTLLFPFAVLYDGITRLRNHLYNIGHRRSFRFEVAVIGVGNLNVGGSGKTPMIEYLVKLLMNGSHISILSRGYGRVTRGLRFATDQETARTFGDEPLQFYRTFKDRINVIVCEDRAFAIPNILQQHPDTNLILMDDSFQHRSVNPQLNILLTEYGLPFFRDYVMPFGKLREARSGSSRADVIVVTKCPPEISDSGMLEMSRAIGEVAGVKKIFFSSIRYGKPTPFEGLSNGTEMSTDVILVSGIANSAIFETYASAHFNVIKHFSFRDHHRYTSDELLAIKAFVKGVGKPVSILTTEKDMVRLIDPEFTDIMKGLSCYYLPIETVFVKNGSEFDELVRHAILPG